jgi:hypothetical protein
MQMASVFERGKLFRASVKIEMPRRGKFSRRLRSARMESRDSRRDDESFCRGCGARADLSRTIPIQFSNSGRVAQRTGAADKKKTAAQKAAVCVR